MSSLKIFGAAATGGLGILVAGLLLSSVLNLAWSWLFATAIFIFVVAGAIALVLRSQ